MIQDSAQALGRTAETNLDATKQQPSSYEKKSDDLNAETTAYADAEDTYPQQTSSIPNNASYWDLFMTVYMPLIALWFRKSMFGPANLIKSIVVGQVMRFVFVDDISEWISERIPPWLEVILFQGSNNSNGKLDPHAWPPPAFTGLALLTIVALVVHPDGLTWVLLGKLRDAIVSLFKALGQSLEFILNDYGVLPTIIAATTLAAMFFLVFVVIRTLSPKPQTSDKHNNTLSNERKKKKKKSNARHRNNHRRIKSKSKEPPNMENEVDELPEASPCSPIPSPPPSEVPEDTLSSPTLAAEKVVESELEVPSLSATSSTTTTEVLENSCNESKDPIDNVSLNKPQLSKDNKTRRRMMSGSTLDTTPLSDDQSCGSVSVRSFPSVSVNSNRSGGSGMKKNKNSTPRRLKRHGNAKSPKNAERNSGRKNKTPNNSSVDATVTTSRWDALKPESGNGGKHNNKSNNNNNSNGHNNHANGNTPNRKQHQQRNRGNSRRVGRKGRNHPKSRVVSRSPKRESTNDSCPSNPFADSNSPPPPPGFQKVSPPAFEPPQLLATPLFDAPVRSPPNHTSVTPEFFRGPVQENPFSNDSMNHYHHNYHQANLDRQIEADLQELGGQMAGSILDF